MITNIFLKAQELSDLDKWKIYILYLLRYYRMRYFHLDERYFKEPVSFEFFISLDNYKEYTYDNNWEKDGWAQRVRRDYTVHSLAYWYIRDKRFTK
jgi:hypothetical protein